MRQGEDGRSSTEILWNLQREVLVEPARSVGGGRPGTSVKDGAKLVGWLRADSVVAVVHREGNADLDATFYGFLEPIHNFSESMHDRPRAECSQAR
jgi:hypothetical protein